MSEFSVTVHSLKKAVNMQQNLSNSMNEYNVRINEIIRNLNIEGTGGTAVKSKLKKLAEETTQEGKKIDAASKTLSEIATIYANTENRLSPVGTAKRKSAKKKNSKEKKDLINAFLDVLKKEHGKLLKEYGPLGAFLLLVTGKEAGNPFKEWKLLNSIVGGGAGAVNKAYQPDWWKYLLGLDSKGKMSLAKAWEELKKGYKFSKESTKAGNIKTATKWFGHILAIGASVYDNYLEFKDDNGHIKDGMLGRMLGETAIEAAVDIALGIGAGYVLTVIGGPAFLAGGVVLGVNVVSKWLSEKAVSENVSDFLIDKGETTVKSIGNAAKRGIKSIKTAWNSTFSGYSIQPAYGGS